MRSLLFGILILLSTAATAEIKRNIQGKWIGEICGDAVTVQINGNRFKAKFLSGSPNSQVINLVGEIDRKSLYNFDVHAFFEFSDGRKSEAFGKNFWILDHAKFIRGKVNEQCKVDLKRPTKPRSVLHKSFDQLAKNERLIIQQKLKTLDLYKSKIDGIYGKNTRTALDAYNQTLPAPFKLTNANEASKLLDQLIGSRISAVETDGSNQTKTDQEVSLSLLNVGNETSLAKTERDSGSATSDGESEEKPLKNEIKVLYAFNSGDYQTALLGAKLLVPDADKDAFYVLGAMYAKGLGVLQHYKTAHMWLNIAALNGSAEAVSLRDEVQTNMSMADVTAAQDLAMKCIQSAYSDCAGSDYRKTKSSANKQVLDTEKASISQAFKNQSTLRRKQLQYALKELGLYSSRVDGIWGKGTARAFKNYANLSDMTAADATQVFDDILSKVDVPSAFKTAKTVRQKTTTKSTTKPAPAKKQYVAAMGYRPYGNTTMSVRQALDVCKNEGSKAFDSASNGAKFKSNRYSGRCSGSSYSYNCNVQQDSPYGNNLGNAAAIGIMEGIARGLAGRAARDAEMKACMAHYGWKKIK